MKENKLRTGLWIKKSEKGTSYASGKIKINDKEYKIVLFKVGEKKKEKSPDFNIIFEEVKENKDNTQVYADFGNLTEISDDMVAF